MKSIADFLKKHSIELNEDVLAEAEKSFVLKSDFEASESKYKLLKEAFDKTELNHAVKVALIKSGAKSEKALEGFIDRSKITFENGTLSGFEEQLEEIRKENSYLFESPLKDTGAMHSGVSSADPDKMTDDEYYRSVFANTTQQQK